ncbi:MAG: efflux RND transporter permease subunit [Brevinema sp.]
MPILEYLFKNKLVMNVLLLAFIFLGGFVSLNLKRDITPYVEPEYVYVRISYPGASAREIEQNAVIPLEKNLQSLDQSISLTTVLADNAASIYINLAGSSDLKDVKQRTIRLIQTAAGVDPRATVYITEEGPSSVPMYYFALYRDTNSSISALDFQRVAADVQRQVQGIESLSGVSAGGLLQEEIQIIAKPDLIQRFYVSLYEIIQAVQNRNLTLSGGLLDFQTETKNLVTDGGFKNPLDVKDLIIRANFENQKIRVKDIAEVREGVDQKNFLVEINGGEGVFFALKMKANGDINAVTKQIDQSLTLIQSGLPQGVELQVVERRFEAVDAILSTAQNSALVGICIVFLILLLFFDWRTSLWTTVTIPTTLAITFIYMYFSDISINIVSLCAIITVLGMLVDHGIIISENIYHYRLQGFPPIDALRRGIKDVALPVLVTVLTTIAAFLPLLSIQGILGGIIRPIPLVVSAALIISFVDAVLFLPAHLGHVPDKVLPRAERPWVIAIRNFYEKMLKKALKARYFVVLFFFLTLLATGALVQKMMQNFILMPPIGVGSIFLQLEAPKDISFEAMKDIVKEAKAIVEKAVPPDQRNALKTMTGEHTIWDFSYIYPRNNIGQVAVYLKPEVWDYEQVLDNIKRDVDASSLGTKLQTLSYETYGLVPKTKEGMVLFFTQKPNFPESDDYKAMMMDAYTYLNTVPGVTKARHTSIQGSDQLLVSFDYEKTAQLGIDVKTVAETLRIAAGGLTISKWQSSTTELSYILKLDLENQDKIKLINEMLIPNRFMRLIPLKEFATISEQPSDGDMLRTRGRRMVEIGSEIDSAITSAPIVLQTFNQYYSNVLIPKYPGAELYLDGESADIQTYFGSFFIAFVMAVSLIYLILLMLFKSAIQPFIVLIAIPFGIVGAFWAFYFHGQQLSFMSFVGLIGLSGVVVNDAVVMVDFINNVMGTASRAEAPALIVQGASKRFKAVMLTTVTTLAGLLPSVYGLSGVADMIVPIATAMAYGLLFATLLTLFFIPALYLIGLDAKQAIKKIFVH